MLGSKGKQWVDAGVCDWDVVCSGVVNVTYIWTWDR